MPPSPSPSPSGLPHPPSWRPAHEVARLRRFAQCALDNVGREYPHLHVHLALGPEDLASPRALHPAFHGSYDWHSAVHMHWLLVRVRTLLGAGEPLAARIGLALDATLTPEAIAGEIRYFEAPGRAAFERPYGWAWLLRLHAACLDAADGGDPDAGRWRDALAPLAARLAGRWRPWLQAAPRPVRAGTHANSAFAAALALPWARRMDPGLDAAMRTALLRWFDDPRPWPAHLEPDAEDFLSPGLCIAVAMLRAHPRAFATWWPRFAPDAAGLAVWCTPVSPVDRADAKLAHLDGLNLSRAWALGALAGALAGPEPLLARRLAEAARAHLDAALPFADAGEYVGTHWLASFALLALDD